MPYLYAGSLAVNDVTLEYIAKMTAVKAWFWSLRKQCTQRHARSLRNILYATQRTQRTCNARNAKFKTWLEQQQSNRHNMFYFHAGYATARIPFRHSREEWLPSINLVCHLLLIQWNTSFHLLYPSSDIISFCVIPTLFSSPAIPSVCKILKLCRFGILSVPSKLQM